MPQIFLSYSGRLGQAMAGAVHAWLANLGHVGIWYAGNLTAGERWLEEIADGLNKADRAILCITRRSAYSPWTHFEAGAVFKGADRSRIVPYLLDLAPGKLTFPLSAFQAVTADRQGTLRLLNALGLSVPDQVPKEAFDREWPKLAAQLSRLRRRAFRRRCIIPASVVLFVAALIVWIISTASTSIFPDFEPAVERLNTANAAPLQLSRASCTRDPNTCPRGHRHSFHAALSGGYATLSLDRWKAIDLQGREIHGSLIFKAGTRLIELAIVDTAGNTSFFDCQADSRFGEVVPFSAPLRPGELLDAGCRIDLTRVRTFAIGYASAAGKGDHRFELLDISLTSNASSPLAGASVCRLRQCAQ